MPVIDDCAPQVVRALQKAAWTVNTKPNRKILENRIAYFDLIAAKQEASIYIEIKCFPVRLAAGGGSLEEYIAIGQYLVYRAMLDLLGEKTLLYLAIPNTIYRDFDKVILKTIRDNHINLLIFDSEAEVILEWIES